MTLWQISFQRLSTGISHSLRGTMFLIFGFSKLIQNGEYIELVKTIEILVWRHSLKKLKHKWKSKHNNNVWKWMTRTKSNQKLDKNFIPKFIEFSFHDSEEENPKYKRRFLTAKERLHNRYQLVDYEMLSWRTHLFYTITVFNQSKKWTQRILRQFTSTRT